MKMWTKLALALLVFSSSSTCCAETPLEVVNARMAAHNRHDLTAFLSCYADGIEVYDFPDIKLGTGGKKHLRKIFSPLFAEGSVKTTVHTQMTNGNFVVNRETVVRDEKTTEYISIYEVEDNLIVSVRFIK